MIFPNLRLFLIVFIIILSVSISVAYVSSISREHERFMSLSTLGSNMTASNYYPHGTPDITLGDVVKWYIQVYNRMDNAEYVSVRIKLLNSTQEIPNDNLHTPSPIAHIYEFKQALANNATLTLPLQWKISMIAKDDEYVIKQIIINDEIIDVDARSVDGKDFRMVIELWVYNTESKQFEYSWFDGNKKRSVWNQIWFNIK